MEPREQGGREENGVSQIELMIGPRDGASRGRQDNDRHSHPLREVLPDKELRAAASEALVNLFRFRDLRLHRLLPIAGPTPNRVRLVQREAASCVAVRAGEGDGRHGMKD